MRVTALQSWPQRRMVRPSGADRHRHVSGGWRADFEPHLWWRCLPGSRSTRSHSSARRWQRRLRPSSGRATPSASPRPAEAAPPPPWQVLRIRSARSRYRPTADEGPGPGIVSGAFRLAEANGLAAWSSQARFSAPPPMVSLTPSPSNAPRTGEHLVEQRTRRPRCRCRLSAARPFACSGDMYAAVPRMTACLRHRWRRDGWRLREVRLQPGHYESWLAYLSTSGGPSMRLGRSEDRTHFHRAVGALPGP